MEWAGGSVRKVFCKSESQAASDVQKVTQDLEDNARGALKKFIQSCPNISSSFELTGAESHRIIRVEPAEKTDHRQCIALPLSVTVTNLMCEEAAKARHHQILDWLRKMQVHCPDLSGDIFENVAHAWLVTFTKASFVALNTLTCLNPGAQSQKLFCKEDVNPLDDTYHLKRVDLTGPAGAPKCVDVTGPAGAPKRVDLTGPAGAPKCVDLTGPAGAPKCVDVIEEEGASEMAKGEYHVPLWKHNYPVVDAWMLHPNGSLVCFQMTKKKQHAPTHTTIKAWLKDHSKLYKAGLESYEYHTPCVCGSLRMTTDSLIRK